MRRGVGDLVPMPLPQQWGPTVIPPGSQGPPLPIPAGSTIGWAQVQGGWILAVQSPGGAVSAVPGASVVPYPGAPAPPSTLSYGSDPGGLLPIAAEPALRVQTPVSGGGVPIGSTLPGGAWGRAPVLPDSLLPPTLQRGNPLLRHMSFRSNAYDGALQRQAARWGYIRSHGGLKGCCRLAELGAPIYDEDPRLVMPSQGEPFQEMFSVPTADFVAGVDTVLGEFVVPNGYDGVLNRFVCNFTGNGFLDFSGFIFWRVKVNSRYARNLGNVQNTYGTFQTSFMVPGTDAFRLVSQQTVQLIANIPVGSPVSDGVVAAGAFGWFYPRR
jgi:hypothetical protein